MYPDPNTAKQQVADTIPPPSCEDTQKQFRLDIDPDDPDVVIIDDDGYCD